MFCWKESKRNWRNKVEIIPEKIEIKSKKPAEEFERVFKKKLKNKCNRKMKKIFKASIRLLEQVWNRKEI